MAILTRDAILGAQDLQTQDVPVPEWGGDVRIRVLTGAERDALSVSMLGSDGKPDLSTYKVRLVAACVVGEDGQRLFSDADISALGAKSALALQRVFDAADTLNAMAPGAVEAAEKN